MKKILFVLVSLVSMLCVSCSNDNSFVDEPENMSQNVVGHWKSNIVADFNASTLDLFGIETNNNVSVNFIYNYDIEFYFSEDKSVIIKLIWHNCKIIESSNTRTYDLNDLEPQYIFGTYSNFNNSIIIKLEESEYSDKGDIYEIEYLNVNSKTLKIREITNNLNFMVWAGYLLPNKNAENFNYNSLSCDNNGYYTFTKI